MQTYMSGPLKVARHYWGMSLVRGIVLIVFGLLTVFLSHLTIRLFMTVFGVFAIIEGITLLGNAFTQRKSALGEEATYRANETPRAREGYMARDASPMHDTYQARDTGPEEEFYQTREAQAARNTREASDVRGVRPARASYGAHEAQPTRTRAHSNPKALVFEGVLSIICGILALILPAAGTIALYVVAAWALFEGLGSVMQTRSRGWTPGLVGVVALILFLVLLFSPLLHIFVLLVLRTVGIFALIMGIVLVVRAVHHNTTTAPRVRTPEPTY